MNMKKIFTCVVLTIAATVSFSQTTDFKAQYERQVRNVGYDGIGVETIINKWEAASPLDADMLLARYHYYMARASYTEVVPKAVSKFMGKAPAVTLKDENGNEVGYFEETFFDEEPFGQAQQVLDRMIALFPDEISYRYEKISSLISYEKEYPDMAAKELRELLDYHSSQHPSWTYLGEAMGEDDFVDAIQEYCYTFFTINSETSLNAFLDISTRMGKLYPKKLVFLSNQGSYWLLKGNNTKALKCYTKVLKVDPKDYSAIKNCILLARKTKDEKLEMKYLPMLIEATESETEKFAAQGRMQALSNKK